MTYNDDTYIRNLCNRLDLDYRNLNSLDSSFNVESINYFNKNFILSLCKLYNFKNCFTSMTEDDFSKLYLDMIFKNEFTFNTKNKTKFRKNDVSIYNILNYTTNEEINNMLTGYNFVCIDKNKYHLDYFNNLDDLNYYWRNNLSNNYLELKRKSDNISLKIEQVFDSVELFKYGFVVTLPKDYIPFWMWENLFNHLIDNYSLYYDNESLRNIYNYIHNNKTVDKNVNDLSMWRFNYNHSNRKFIFYNFDELQDLLYEAKVGDNVEIHNTIESFLEGNFCYKILQDFDDTYLNYNQIYTNFDNFSFVLKNIPYDNLLSNFKFNNLEKNTCIHI